MTMNPLLHGIRQLMLCHCLHSQCFPIVVRQLFVVLTSCCLLRLKWLVKNVCMNHSMYLLVKFVFPLSIFFKLLGD